MQGGCISTHIALHFVKEDHTGRAAKLNMKALLVLFVCVVAVQGSFLDFYKKIQKGDGTYYGKEGYKAGHCTLNPIPYGGKNKISAPVAISTKSWYGSLACGMCIKVKGTGRGLGANPIKGTKYVYVQDSCPSCPQPGDIDFSLDGDGRWDISWQAVQCPVGTTKIDYKLQGSNIWYLKLQVRNTRLPVARVELYQLKSKVWKAMQRTMDGFWTTTGDMERPFKFPCQVKLTDINGKSVKDFVPELKNDEVLPGTGKQFACDKSLPFVPGDC